MKRWDSLVDGYLAQCEARGLSQETLQGRRSELDRLGCWLKRRRPKPKLEEVDGQLLIKYLQRRTHFRAKATVAGAGQPAAVLWGVSAGAGSVGSRTR